MDGGIREPNPLHLLLWRVDPNTTPYALLCNILEVISLTLRRPLTTVETPVGYLDEKEGRV